MIQVPVVVVAIWVGVAATVFLMLVWSVQVNNRRWRMLAHALQGKLRVYAGLALQRTITGSIRQHPFEIREASASRNVLPGTAIKVSLPMGYHLRIWKKRIPVFYPNLKKITFGSEMENRGDIYRRYDFYTDDPDQAKALLTNAAKSRVVEQLVARGGFEVNPNHLLCTLRDRSMVDDPLQHQEPSKTHQEFVRLLESMTSLAR